MIENEYIILGQFLRPLTSRNVAFNLDSMYLALTTGTSYKKMILITKNFKYFKIKLSYIY